MLHYKYADSAVFSIGLVLKSVRDRGQNQIPVKDQLHHTSIIFLIFKYMFSLFTIKRQKVKKT